MGQTVRWTGVALNAATRAGYILMQQKSKNALCKLPATEYCIAGSTHCLATNVDVAFDNEVSHTGLTLG